MEKEFYFHKTFKNDIDTINDIFNRGLRCNYFTPFFTINHAGKYINVNALNSYASSDQIVFIIAVPKDFVIDEDEDDYPDLVHAEADAFMYYPEGENVPYLRKEFVFGYYVPKTRCFVLNNNFFENLNSAVIDELFIQVQEEYCRIYDRVDNGILNYK